MPNEPWLLVGLAVLSTGLLLGWYGLEKQRTDSTFWRFVAQSWVRGLAVFFYFVGIPYLALISGLLTPRSLGLSGLEHFSVVDLGSGTLVYELQRALTLMLLDWLLDSPLAFLAGLLALLLLVAIQLSLGQHQVDLRIGRERVLVTLYFGVHWAFYRAIFWTVTADLYLGVVFGVAYVLLEWSLLLWLRRAWGGEQQKFLVSSIVLLLTSAIFFYSPNLWFLLLIQIAMMAIVNRRWAVAPGPESVAH